jgi:hypothetical protein
MIITQKTPDILVYLYKTYKKANKNGIAFKTIEKCIIHNNEPVNILTAIKALKDVECMVRIGHCHNVEYEYCIRYLSEVTGYSPIEIIERSEI